MTPSHLPRTTSGMHRMSLLGIIGAILLFVLKMVPDVVDVALRYWDWMQPLDCTAPDPASPAWERCAAKLAAQTLDPVAFGASVLYRPRLASAGDYGPRRPLTQGTALHTGDQYQLALQPPVPARLYLFYRDGAGRLTDLVRQALPEGVLEPHRSYLLPDPYAYTLDQEIGAERLYLLLLPSGAYPLLDHLTHSLNGAQGAADPVAAQGAATHLVALLDGPLAGHGLRLDYRHLAWDDAPASPSLDHPSPGDAL